MVVSVAGSRGQAGGCCETFWARAGSSVIFFSESGVRAEGLDLYGGPFLPKCKRSWVREFQTAPSRYKDHPYTVCSA